MCGIAGYLGPAPLGEEAVQRALKLMHRRGPDGQRVRRFQGSGQHVALLHSRLSIIDLDERADQPFAIDGKWLVYNGELYNYREIRRELEQEGQSFATQSDTEVLLRALVVWGWDALDRFEGMWSFALYDTADGSLSLCRDRFGEKPLHYWTLPDGGLCFGSEVKFLSALAGRSPKPDETQVLRFLVNGYKALYKQPNGFFHDVEEVPRATVLRIDREGRRTQWQYWRPDYDPEPLDLDYQGCVAAVRERLITATELRLRSDVPLAFCMSGGVDSNTLIAIAKRVLGYDVHGFTIVNTDARYEEMELVETAVRDLGLRHTKVPLSSHGFLDGLRTLVRQHDAPVLTITYYVHWLLEAAMADAGYRVSISGTAADELFSGYFDHHLAYLYEIRNDAPGLEESVTNWRRCVGPTVRNPFLQDPLAFCKDPFDRRHVYLESELFTACLRKPWREAFQESQYSRRLLRNRMLNETFHETVPVLLHEDDLNAMHHSIENRSPFLDRGLFELMLRVPTRFLIRNGLAKAILRDAGRGIVPDAIIDNPRKVGFNAPIEDLVDRDDPGTRAEILRDSPIFTLVDPDAVRRFFDQPELPNSQSKFLFSFLSAKMFLEEFGS